MNTGVVIALGLVVLLVVAIVAFRPTRKALRKRRRNQRIRALRTRYVRLLNEPPRLARETLQRQLEGLEEDHPGKTPEWYLEKLISDLERARR